MIRPTPLWRSVAVLGAAALVLTACGGDDENADTSDATTPTASDSPSESPSGGGGSSEADGTLTLGTLLPQTGNLAFLGPPEFAGVNLAVEEMNAAGGVLGQPVAKSDGDSGDSTTDIASQTVNQLLSQNVDAIIGAASSAVTLSVIDAITGAGVVQMSPANTSAELTTREDAGLYFRTAPSDVLQGQVHGNAVADSGAATLGMIVIDDSYGNGLADVITETYEEAGGSVVARVPYDPGSANFTSVVSEVLAESPDAISLIAFDETIQIVPELVTQGFDPANLYFVDGNLSDYGEDFDPGLLEGAQGTLPGAQAPQAFRDRLLQVDPELTDFSYSAESYDAAIVIALAAIAADSDAGTAIGEQLSAVTSEGEECTTFEQCSGLLAEGTDIDYNGVSGPIEFNEDGDPATAFIGLYEFDANNAPVFQEAVEVSLPE